MIDYAKMARLIEASHDLLSVLEYMRIESHKTLRVIERFQEAAKALGIEESKKETTDATESVR